MTPKPVGVTWRKSSHSGTDENTCVEVAAVWRTSSYTGSNEATCVEVAAAGTNRGCSSTRESEPIELSDSWDKSRHSGGNEGECVEVRAAVGRVVAARDSKDPEGPVLCFDQAAWGGFFNKIKAGEYDLG